MIWPQSLGLEEQHTCQVGNGRHVVLAVAELNRQAISLADTGERPGSVATTTFYTAVTVSAVVENKRR